MTEAQANATYRGFNYPHQIASYYSMYRTARNHDKLKTRMSWQWYLERAANTTLRLPPAHIGYMDGTVFREVLRSVLEENATANGARSRNHDPADDLSADGAAGNLWNELGAKLLAGQASRAKYWSTAMWPYGSEFSYDTTGQEEVVVWLLYFGYDVAAKRTVDHILSYMRSLPNWAYMGGADAGDVANGGKWLTSAGTGVGDMGKMHYRAGLNQIPLSEWYRTHPDDFFLLEVVTGAQSGQLTNIDEAGAPAIYYHAYPWVQEHDAYSGDYGLGFFGSSLETGSTFVLHKSLGPLCYLCDHNSTGAVHTIVPRDAYRQRVFLEPLGLWLQADAGVMESVSLDMTGSKIVVAFAPPSDSPAGVQSYSKLRLRVDQTSRPGLRPGSEFKVTQPTGLQRVRDAFEIPAEDAAVKVEIGWQK